MKALEYLLSRPLLCTETAAETARDVALRLNERPSVVEAREGRPIEKTEYATRRGSVALIDVVGPIHRYADFFSDVCGGVTTECLARDITAAVDDPTISAVVLNFDSPGGEATGISELAEMVYGYTARKPIVAYAAGDMCSGAFWVGTACSEVVASDTAFLGSVGVVAAVPLPTDDPKRPKVTFLSSQSPNKRPDLTTEKGRAVVQQSIDDLAQVFIDAVARYRDMTAEAVVKDFCEGGVLVGQKAVDAGMVDRLGSLEGVIAELNDPRRDRAATSHRPGRTAQSTNDEEPSMQWSPKALRAWFAKGMPENFDPAAVDATNPPETAKPEPASLNVGEIDLAQTPAVQAMQREIDALKAANAAIEREKLEALATAFVQSEFHAGRCLPAEANALKQTFLLAAQDDAAHPIASGSRVENLRTLQSQRPKHAMFREQVSQDALPKELRFIGAQMAPQAPEPIDPNAPPTEERTNELLGKFAAGRALLAQQKAAKAS